MSRQAYPVAAQRRAREVLRDLGLTQLPIDAEQVASLSNLQIHTRPDFPPNCFGALVRRGNEYFIMVSATCFGSGHRRFTIAHELGHYFLDGHCDALLQGDTPALSRGAQFTNRKDPFEVEADAFSAELLMPSNLIRPVVDAQPAGLQAVRTIVESFDVSTSAAAVRFAQVTSEPAAVLLSRNGILEWASFSGPFKAHRWAKPWVRGEWVPPRSRTAWLNADPNRVLNCLQQSGSGILSEWFPEGLPLRVHEEALGLGGYGRILTILTCPDLPDPEEAEEAEAESEPKDWRDALRSYRLG